MPSERRPSRDHPSEAGASAKVELGRVVGAHGLRGEVRVRVFGDDPHHLVNAEEVWLGSDRDDPGARRFAVRSRGMGRANEVRLGLQGVGDRDAAQALRGRVVLGRSEDLEPLAEGEFYWHQLVGCEVETETGQYVGRVVEIWETGAHDVLVVRDDRGRQNLVPTARDLTREIDLAGRRIVVAAIPGLLDLGEGDSSDAEGG